ncbi:MAG: hypothetical protein IPH37_16630 [Burkholderiales bacterium]|nr:hypothetical protein [Burkholderiales bacterium]
MIFPFFGAPADYFVKLFEPETMLYLHYPVFAPSFCSTSSRSFFTSSRPRSTGLAVCCGRFGFVHCHDDHSPQSGTFPASENLSIHRRPVRRIRWLLSADSRDPASETWFRHSSGWYLVHLGDRIQRYPAFIGRHQQLCHGVFGTAIFVGTMLYVASNTFANTFVENKILVKDLKVLNDNLEHLVTERTAQLAQKTHDIQAMMQNMPQGVLTVLANNVIHPEYSAYPKPCLKRTRLPARI